LNVVHAKRSLNSRLYNLNYRFKSSNCLILSQNVINYLTKSLQQGLNSIIPDTFGEHNSCDISWCGYKQNPTTYKHTAYQMERIFLENPSKKAVTELFDEHSTEIVVNKLTPCANSQRSESLKSTIATKNYCCCLIFRTLQ